MARVPRVVSILASVVLFTSVSTAPAWAQLATPELNGRVTDSSGAVLPGVTVTATTATGLVRYAASFIKLADGTVQQLGQDVEGIFGTKIWR